MSLLGKKRDGGYNLFGCWPESPHNQRDPFLYALAQPGRDGALHTINTVLMMEGVQECEARIFLEKALIEKKLTGPLAEKCRALLAERSGCRRMPVGGFRLTVS